MQAVDISWLEIGPHVFKGFRIEPGNGPFSGMIFNGFAIKNKTTRVSFAES